MASIINHPIPKNIKRVVNKKNSLSYKIYKKVGSFGKKHNASSGAFGTYFKLNKNVGVKVIRPHRDRTDDGVPYMSLYHAQFWKDAVKEFNILVSLQRSGLTPIPYALKPIKIGKGWFPGIFMQHIEGLEMGQIKDNKTKVRISNRANDAIQLVRDNFGFHFNDHSHHNYIVTPDENVVLIDCSPDYCFEISNYNKDN